MTSLLDRITPAWPARVQLVLDLCLIATGVLLGGREGAVRPEPSTSFILVGAACTLWMVMAAAVRLYNPWTERHLVDAWAMSLVALAPLAVALALLAAAPTSRAVLGHPASVIGFWALALSLRAIVLRPRRWPGDEEDVLVVGAGTWGQSTVRQLAQRGPRSRVQGCLSFPNEPAWVSDEAPPHLGSSKRLREALAEKPINEVYIAGNPLHDAAAMQSAIRACEELGVPFAIPANPFRLVRSSPACPDAIRDGYLHYLTFECKPSQMALKRLLDIAVSGIALVVLLPMLLVVSALIKLTSPGPVLFRQVRAGLRGRPFSLLKFRSMVANADALRPGLDSQNEVTGPVFKIKSDPRITPLGRFLRKHSIDELPQLLNVLRGDLSLVGPRPPLHSEVAQYQTWQRRRLSVRPGLTCDWQVSGRNDISFEEWMYLDMQYIDHWSLRRDLALILKTLPVVLSGRGAS